FLIAIFGDVKYNSYLFSDSTKTPVFLNNLFLRCGLKVLFPFSSTYIKKRGKKTISMLFSFFLKNLYTSFNAVLEYISSASKNIIYSIEASRNPKLRALETPGSL